MSEYIYIKPQVSKELWLEKPDVAEDRMNTSAQEATSYTPHMAGGAFIITMFALSQLVKRAAGPYAGLIDLAMSVFKQKDQSTSEPQRYNSRD